MPGRRGERRRPVTALTTGRWAATLLTLALLSPLAGVAHGSGEPAPAPSRAHSPLPRERQRDVRGAIRARGVRAAPRDGHRVPPLARRRGGAVRQLDGAARRLPVGRRDRRARLLPPRPGPTPRRRLGRRRGRRDRRAGSGAHKKRQSTQQPSTTAELYTPRTPSSPKPSELGDYTTPRRRPCASSGTSAPSGPRARRCEPRGDPTTCTSFERKPASRWTSTRRFGKTSRGRSRSAHNPQTHYEP